MNIREYIKSGIVEAYIMGLATEQERTGFEQNLKVYPELTSELHRAEQLIESLARNGAVMVPAQIRREIEARIATPVKEKNENNNNGDVATLVGISNTQIRVHKYWRPVFIGVFILSKIFLILAVYYFLSYRQAAHQIHVLEQQVQHSQTVK